MVGVSFMITILYYLSDSVYSYDDCPAKCNCLGDYVLCTGKNLEIVPTIPTWTGRLNLNNNRIRSIDGNVWKNVKLTQLKLNKNKISRLGKEALINQTSLMLLELNRNNLKTIIPLTFTNSKQLTVLKLKKNHINKLEDGAFFGLISIKTLKLDYNLIQSISKKWLYGLKSLEDLSVSHNKINIIEPGAWEFCPDLIELDLSFNNLASIKRDTFNHLKSLQKLSLNDNKISFIDDGAFGNIPDLRILYLSKNKISFIIEDSTGVFKKLTKLNKFYIAANDIKSINKNAFLGLNNITTLDLSRNNISSIQKNPFDDMPLLQDLQLNTTSLLCDCNIKWFYDWLKIKKLKVNTICAHPEVLRNQSLLNVPPSNFTCDDLVKPRLIDEPEPEIMALKNANISLSCRAMSNSPSTMKVYWKKDNKELVHANITSRTLNKKRNMEVLSVLNIFNVQHADAGIYQCIVSNNFGATYSQKTNISVLIFPVFSKVPQNVTVSSGTTVKLECAAEGEPPPQISWQKDGGNDFPSARERRIHVMHPDDDIIFIVKAKPVDMGVYTCTAGNPAGKISVDAILTIEEKPFLGKPMENKEITAGESVVLQCMAGGAPKPSIQWLKDGAPIRATERHFFTAEEQLMIIVDTVASDEGTYQCHLNNSLGNVTGYSELLVKSVPSARADNTGIIVITIVCCAVITSSIWVVIIYQAKTKVIKRVTNLPATEIPQLEFTEKPANQFNDDISERSSCKDSGTGDSAKRSNDDLLPSEEYPVIIKDIGPNMDPQTTMRTASLLCLSSEKNNSETPLLYSDRVFVRTNHDRVDNPNSSKANESSTDVATDD